MLLVLGALYVSVAVTFLFLALCGQQPCFIGTPVEQATLFLLGGCFDSAQCATAILCRAMRQPHVIMHMLLVEMLQLTHIQNCLCKWELGVNVAALALLKACFCIKRSMPCRFKSLAGCRRLINRLLGQRAANALARAEHWCCKLRNPTFAILYLALLAGSYHIYTRFVFALLPTPFSASWHQCAPTIFCCTFQSPLIGIVKSCLL